MRLVRAQRPPPLVAQGEHDIAAHQSILQVPERIHVDGELGQGHPHDGLKCLAHAEVHGPFAVAANRGSARLWPRSRGQKTGPFAGAVLARCSGGRSGSSVPGSKPDRRKPPTCTAHHLRKPGRADLAGPGETGGKPVAGVLRLVVDSAPPRAHTGPAAPVRPGKPGSFGAAPPSTQPPRHSRYPGHRPPRLRFPGSGRPRPAPPAHPPPAHPSSSPPSHCPPLRPPLRPTVGPPLRPPLRLPRPPAPDPPARSHPTARQDRCVASLTPTPRRRTQCPGPAAPWVGCDLAIHSPTLSAREIRVHKDRLVLTSSSARKNSSKTAQSNHGASRRRPEIRRARRRWPLREHRGFASRSRSGLPGSSVDELGRQDRLCKRPHREAASFSRLMT